MKDQLSAVRDAFEKAMGPFRKRQKIVEDLKEPDLRKTRRAELVVEAAELDEEWKAALIELRKAMETSQAFPESETAPTK